MICNSADCKKRERCKSHIYNNPQGTYVDVFDFSTFGGGFADSLGNSHTYTLCGEKEGYPLFAEIPNVTTESLLSWIENGKVTETGDYSKGWNDSIDSILNHMRLLGIKWNG